MAEDVDIPVIGGLLHAARVHRPATFAAWSPNYRLVHVEGRDVYIPSRWPPGSEMQGMALVRIYGADETRWPANAVSALYEPRESRSA